MEIRLSKTVAAQLAKAFAVVANVLDWPHIIQSVKRIELLTPGLVREGARLREERIMFGRIEKHEMEMTIDRPHRLRMLIEHPDLGYERDHLVDGVYGGGCRIMLIVRSRPAISVGHAAQPFIAPFMEITLRDELEQDLSDLAAAITQSVSWIGASESRPSTIGKLTMAGFRPLDRILVRRVEVEERTSGGIIIPDTARRSRLKVKRWRSVRECAMRQASSSHSMSNLGISSFSTDGRDHAARQCNVGGSAVD